MKTIELSQVTKSFGNKEVLKGIDLGVEEGEILGLLGPSGAGKTTILNILSGQIPPDSGYSALLGQDSQRLRDEDHRRIGLVLDNCGLYPRMSVYDNLALFASIYGVDKAAVEQVLEQVGLIEDHAKRAEQLSKGMKQRLVFARAILHHPKILFLDEPTSGLDPATTLRIHELIQTLKEEGTTIFLTTHHMEEATKLCDHVALLHEGVIVAYGSVEELCHTYREQDDLLIKLNDGSIIHLANCPANSERVAQLMREEQIASIHSSDATLEDVFMKLTGRKLI